MKSKEESFQEIIDNLKFREGEDNLFYYFKDHYTYFDYDKKTKVLYYNYSKIYSVFKVKYNMQDNEVVQFIKEQIYKYFKLNIVTACKHFY